MNQLDIRLLEARLENEELREQYEQLKYNYEQLYRFTNKLREGRIKVVNIYN